jgi:hypothetical protein
VVQVLGRFDWRFKSTKGSYNGNYGLAATVTSRTFRVGAIWKGRAGTHRFR